MSDTRWPEEIYTILAERERIERILKHYESCVDLDRQSRLLVRSIRADVTHGVEVSDDDD